MNTTQETESTTTHEMQQSIDNQVEKMDAQANAVDAQLELEPEQARQRVDEHKHKVEQAGQRILEKIEQAGGQDKDVIDPLKAALEHLQVQLALAWAEGRDAYEEQKKQIESSIAGFVNEVDRAAAAADLDATGAVRSLKRAFVTEVNALEAELTAAELQYVEDKEKVKAEWARQKQSVKDQIAQFKSELEEKGQQASEKLEKFEDELSDGLSQLKKAFTHLLS